MTAIKRSEFAKLFLHTMVDCGRQVLKDEFANINQYQMVFGGNSLVSDKQIQEFNDRVDKASPEQIEACFPDYEEKE